MTTRGDDAQQPRQVGAKTEGCLNRRGHGATVLAGDRIKFVEGGSNREPSDDKAEERRRVNKPRKPVADEGHGERRQKANDDQHTQNAVACISADFSAPQRVKGGCMAPSAEIVTPGNSNQQIQHRIVATNGISPSGVRIPAIAGGRFRLIPRPGCCGAPGAGGG